MTALRMPAVRWLLLGWGICAPHPAHALDPGRPLSQHRLDRWGAEQGFPGGAVHAIDQSADGYLWIGTENGLVRFDGTAFRIVPTTRSFSGSVPRALGLMADALGGLWARLDQPTMLRYRDGRFEDLPFVDEPREVAVTAMCRARDGSALVYAQVGGLLRFREGRFERLTASTIPSSLVISMAQTPDGRIWMGTRDSGLFSWDGGQVLAVAEGLPDRKVNCLLPTDDAELWVGTDHGIVRWNGTALTREGVPAALARVQALAMIRDHDANVWVGTGTGVLRANASGVASLGGGGPAAGGPVAALFEDREGNLWTGSAQGINRLRDTPFTTYARAQGLPSESNGPVHADAAGRVWFGPADGGLHWLEGEKVRRVLASGLEADLVYSIARAADGLWIGRQRRGLTHLRFEGGAWPTRTYTAAEGLAQDSVYAVHEGRDGTVWAGTLSGGLSRLRDGRFTTYTTANGLSSNTVASILDTSDGTVWIATPNGLNAFSLGKWRAYGLREGLPSENVTSLLEDTAGVLWAGTGAGLAFVRSGRVGVPRAGPESLREPVLGLAASGTEWLWMATASRVLRVKREALLQGVALGEAEVVAYDAADGLLATGGVRRHRSVVTDARGRVWFSLSRGLSVVDPQRAIGRSAPALAHVLALTADGRPMDLRGPLRIPPGPQRVSFGYAGISLSIPERIRFRYRLDGFDQAWSEPVISREAVYANLAPGPYRFRVTASSGDGVWSGAEDTVSLAIAPALWQTWWFQLAAVLSAGLGARVFYGWRLGQATRRLNALFEERLAERTRIAQELHDTLLQGFLSASLQLHVAVEQLPEASPARSLLGRVQQLMRQVIEEGRNTLRGLRSSDQGVGDLAEAFSRVREDLRTDDSTDLRVIVEGAPRALRPPVRDEVYRIGREALANAFRHAGAGHVEIELEYGAHELRVLVRDDGCGIDPQVLQSGREGHWGLSGMRERAERIGGRLRLWSAPGAGTEVELLVRSSLAFSSSPSGGLLRWLRNLRRHRPSGDAEGDAS